MSERSTVRLDRFDNAWYRPGRSLPVRLVWLVVNAAFFLTWFPIYLVKERGMSVLQVGFVSALPALCGFVGGIGGGAFSDWLLRRGRSLTGARKKPIVVGPGHVPLDLDTCFEFHRRLLETGTMMV